MFALQIKLDKDKLKGQTKVDEAKDDEARADEKPKAKKPAKGSKS